MVSGVESPAANLNPPLGDVDLGFAVGLQFGNGVNAGDTLSIAMRVNSATANLLAFQVRVAFDADVFEATAGWYRFNPVEARVESDWFQRLKLIFDKLLSCFAFNFNLRRCTTDCTQGSGWNAAW
jgi:hypothetical protein